MVLLQQLKQINKHPPPKINLLDSYSFLPQALATTHLHSVCMDLSPLDASHRWNHTKCNLGVWLLSLSIMFSRLMHMVAWISTSFPLRLNNIPSYIHVSNVEGPQFVCIHPLMNIWAVSTFWLQ